MGQGAGFKAELALLGVARVIALGVPVGGLEEPASCCRSRAGRAAGTAQSWGRAAGARWN